MTSIIEKLRSAVSQRRAYNRAIAEIAKIDAREMADLRTDRGTLVASAYQEIYGVAR